MTRHPQRTRYCDPGEDTRIHTALQLLLRRQGARAPELMAALQTSSSGTIGSALNRLENDCGYDLRTFPTPRVKGTMGRTPVIYRIVGRWTYEGEYTDYLATEIEEGDET